MAEETIKFLIAEDEPAVRSLLCSVLEERDYRDFQQAGDGQEAIERIKKCRPDILITDLKMPRMGGEELARRALLLEPDLTILVTTGNGTIEHAVRMIKEGVFDFITKPFSIETLNASIERGVERTRSLAELYGVRGVIEAHILALDSQDVYLKRHSRRVARMSGIMAAKLGWPRKRQRLLEYAALVHDVGKIGIQEQILNKPGPLTPWESSQMRMHPVYSRNILSPVPYLREALPDVYYHHERFDGGGYPEGLKAEAIPIGARIIAICDAYDAMSSDRSYRAAMPEQDTLEILKKMKGIQFDPALVDLFLEHFAEIKEVHDLDH